ncbi:MAG: sigma-54 dependent transcriptional regulator [Pseudomonadota bacterium]
MRLSETERTAVVVGKNVPALRSMLVDALAQFTLEIVSNVETARRRLEREPADLVVLDTCMADAGGSELLEWALSERRAPLAVCCGPEGLTVYGRTKKRSSSAANECVRSLLNESADDAEDRERWRNSYAPGLVGEAPELLAVIDTIRNVADTDCPVLVTGESGTGKELVARALHDASPRATKHFVALNCAAIPDTLMEAELFGHARGAFTGAHTSREGRFVVADGGSLFLDEIGDMPLPLQAKLLRVLQEHAVTPLGDRASRTVDVRVIAATHRDLESLVRESKLRADLYYRLNVIPIRVPPLRDRAEDIVRLARHFLERANRRLGRAIVGLEPLAEELLLQHSWPGNVRELLNMMERLVVLKGRGVVAYTDVSAQLLPLRPELTSLLGEQPLAQLSSGADTAAQSSPACRTGGSLDLRRAQEELERQLIQEALTRAHGNRTEAAALLGLNRTTLVEKLRKIA